MYYLNCFVQNYFKTRCMLGLKSVFNGTYSFSNFLCVFVYFFVLKLLQELDGLIEDHFGTISVTNRREQVTSWHLIWWWWNTKPRSLKSFKKNNYEELSTSCSCSKKMFYEAAEKDPDWNIQNVRELSKCISWEPSKSMNPRPRKIWTISSATALVIFSMEPKYVLLPSELFMTLEKICWKA